MNLQMKRSFFIIIQLTWGILQTLMGAAVFLLYINCPHRSYRCAVDTRWNRTDGLSLGLFIFTPCQDTAYSDRIRVHEYGHCIQSLVLGPLYLIICIISVIWMHFPYFISIRKKKHLPYTSCFVEAWASKWGERITGDSALWD